MDSFLSGREHVGDKPKAKEQLSLSPQILNKLEEGGDEETTEHSEVCGDGGTKVQFVNEGGRVVKIVVTCNCGQVTEVDCQYDD